MKTYTFPYGSGEWDGTIDVELTDEEAALLEEAMKAENFHLDEDPAMSKIDRKVCHCIFEFTKQQMIKDGEFDPDDDDDLVYDRLGNYHVSFPNAFDHRKKE